MKKVYVIAYHNTQPNHEFDVSPQTGLVCFGFHEGDHVFPNKAEAAAKCAEMAACFPYAMYKVVKLKFKETK